jgi:hypothetical protein
MAIGAVLLQMVVGGQGKVMGGRTCSMGGDGGDGGGGERQVPRDEE